MKERLSRNYASVMASEIFSYLIPLILTPYLSRVLGAALLGDYHFTAGIVSYFIMAANLGIVNYAKRETAFRQNDPKERSKLFAELFLFRMMTAGAAAAAYVIFILFFAGNYQKLYIIQMLTFLSAVLDITWLFHGMENYRSVVIRNAVIRIAGMILVFIFVLQPEDLWIYVLLTGLTTLLCSLSLWPSMRKYIEWPVRKDIHIRPHVKGVMIFFASTVAVQLYTVLDQTMLGLISGTTEVGYYAQGQKIIRMGLMLISSLAVVLLPRIAVLYKEKHEKELKDNLKGTFDFLFALSIPMAIGCFTVAPDFVPVFFGDGFLPVTNLLRILSFLFCVLGLGQILGTMLSAIDRQPKSTIAVSVGAVINIVLNSILIRNLHSVGACIASVAAETAVTAAEIIYVNKYMKCGKQILKSFIHYLIPSLVMGGAVLAVHYAIDGDAWLGIIKLVTELLVGVLVYALVLALTKDPLMDRIFPVRGTEGKEDEIRSLEKPGAWRMIKGFIGAVPVCILLAVGLEVGLAFMHRSGSVEKHLIHFGLLMLGAEGFVVLYGTVPGLRLLWARMDRKLLSRESRKPWVDIVYAALAAVMLLHHVYVMLYYPEIPAGASRFAPAWIPFAVITVMLGKLWRNKGFWIGAVFAAYMFERTFLKEPNMSGETMVYMVSMIYSLIICYGALDVIRPEYRRVSLRVLCALWVLATLVFCGAGLYFAWTGEAVKNLGGGITELARVWVNRVKQVRLMIFSNSNITSGIAIGGAMFSMIGFTVAKKIVSKILYVFACFLMVVTNALAATRSGFVMLSLALSGMVTQEIWGFIKMHARIRGWGNTPLLIGLIACMLVCIWGSYTIQQNLGKQFAELRDKSGLIITKAQADDEKKTSKKSSPTPVPDFAGREILKGDIDIDMIKDVFTGQLNEEKRELILNQISSGRWTIWKTAFEYVQEHPETKYLGMSADGSIREAINRPDHSHNILIQIGFEGGIPGLGLYLVLLGYFFFHACRLWKRWWLPLWQRTLPIPVVAVLLMEMAECLTHFAFGHVPMTVLYFFMGATVAVSRSVMKEKTPKQVING